MHKRLCARSRVLARLALILLVPVWLLGALCGSATGQASPTATRAFGFAAFGAASEMDPDYGQPRDYGFVLGGDITRHTRWVDLTIEPRFGSTSGPQVGQRYFVGMIEAGRAFGPDRRIHPYGGIGIGYGTFDFKQNGYTDNSTVYVLNGGLNLDLVGNLGVKLDYQYQFWNLGGNDTFTPNGLSAGVFYRINSLPFLRR